LEGQKTTWPLGTTVAPVNDVPVGVEFEKFRETGSNIPTFEEPTLAVRVRDGVKMMFPEGKRHPPPKKTAQLAFDTGTVTFEDVKAEGLMTRMFEF
jgi:hypothetical protein